MEAHRLNDMRFNLTLLSICDLERQPIHTRLRVHIYLSYIRMALSVPFSTLVFLAEFPETTEQLGTICEVSKFTHQIIKWLLFSATNSELLIT